MENVEITARTMTDPMAKRRENAAIRPRRPVGLPASSYLPAQPPLVEE
jgi:hypothetical protein